MNLGLITGLGIAFFIGYIIFQVVTHKGKLQMHSTNDNREDLELIARNREMELISNTKRVQSIAEKNNLFKRSFINKFGEDALNYSPDQPEWSAKSIPDEKVSPGEVFSFEENLFSNESEINGLPENELAEFTKLAGLTEELGSMALNDISITSIEKNTMNKEHKLEDNYTESQLFEIDCLYNTFKAFYN